MPAIHPARMKIQVARLGEKIRQPEVFVRELHNLLDFYADRTHRPGQFGEPPPLLAIIKPPCRLPADRSGGRIACRRSTGCSGAGGCAVG